MVVLHTSNHLMKLFQRLGALALQRNEPSSRWSCCNIVPTAAQQEGYQVCLIAILVVPMITLTYIRTSRFRCKLHLLSSTNSRCRFRYHFCKKWLEFTHWKSSCLHQRVFSAQLIASTQQICRAMGTVVYIMTLTDLRMLTHLIVPHLQNTGEEHPSGSNYSTNKSSRSSKKPALVRRTRGTTCPMRTTSHH